MSLVGQVSAWQSVTIVPINCKSVQLVPAWVEELVSRKNTLSQYAMSQHVKVSTVETDKLLALRIPPQAENTNRKLKYMKAHHNMNTILSNYHSMCGWKSPLAQ